MPLASSASTVPVADAASLICHCQRVPYRVVEKAIDEGRAGSLADVQRETTACTRCFGCRFELERMLENRLGEAYVRTPFVRVPDAPGGRLGATGLRRRMYMPVFAGFKGQDVTTRVIMFNWPDVEGGAKEDVEMRADLHGLDGSRRRIWEARIASRRSAIIDIGREIGEEELPDGVGVLKIVVDADKLASLRPYFHLITPTGISSTHEKSGLGRPEADTRNRRYFWVFPVAASPFPEDAYFFCTNTGHRPLVGHELIWQSVSGEERRVSLPELGLDQTACVALHEHFPAIGSGRESGTVRLSPTVHVAGFILRHDPRRALWRVQHL